MMKPARAHTTRAILALAFGFPFASLVATAHAAPAREGDFVAHDFRFHAGGTLPALRVHYLALGAPSRDAKGAVTNAVLVLHGTSGSGRQFLVPQFANELYGAGQPLDTTQYYVILPDGIGHGGSSKPSDGLHAKFPHYDYEDMVTAQYRLVTEHLGVAHLRLVMGTSMGGMQTWVWGEAHPEFMDALMPLACLPVAIVGRNRMWRDMLKDAITSDPDWKGGEYKAEPTRALRTALDLLSIAGSAPLPMQASLATRGAVDSSYAKLMKDRLSTYDANDLLYQVDASRDYDPSSGLERITAPMMFVNSGDDFINPPELGIAEREIKRLPHGTFVLLPASAQTHGHGTHTWAALWKDHLVALLAATAGGGGGGGAQR